MGRRKKDETQKLLEVIVEGIKEKKGKDIVSIDLTNVTNYVSDYFVVCHADSNTHVSTIADYLKEIVKKKLNDRVWNTEGKENMQWVLLDYSNIVVHIFQKEQRDFYNLEALWADSNIVRYSSEN